MTVRRFEQRDREDDRVAHAVNDESHLAVDPTGKGDFADSSADRGEERTKWLTAPDPVHKLDDRFLLRWRQIRAKHSDELVDVRFRTPIAGESTELVVTRNEHCGDPVESGTATPARERSTRRFQSCSKPSAGAA